jgi:hypothetical protein
MKEKTSAAEVIFEQAAANATLAQEGFVRCDRYLDAWLSYADPISKLVPRTLDRDRDILNANDCAADNFPFLVLTSYFTDTERYRGRMKEMLDNEIRLTSRIRSLPDTYSFSKKGFQHDVVSMPRIVFGTTEYMKEGLLPVTEWVGASPWLDRMLPMLRDLDDYVDVAGEFGEGTFGNAPEAEVNGELLQILSRMYWFSADKRFLEWAIQTATTSFFNKGTRLQASTTCGCATTAASWWPVYASYMSRFTLQTLKGNRPTRNPFTAYLIISLSTAGMKTVFFIMLFIPKQGRWSIQISGYVGIYFKWLLQHLHA